MGDQWYYHNMNYPGVDGSGYNNYYQAAGVPETAWNQWPGQSSSSTSYSYPVVPPFPPPVQGPFNVPPPAYNQNQYGYNVSYNNEATNNQYPENSFQNDNSRSINDYSQELESYKISKASRDGRSQIDKDSLRSRRNDTSRESYNRSRSKSPRHSKHSKYDRLRHDHDSHYKRGKYEADRSGDGRSMVGSRESSSSRSRDTTRERSMARSTRDRSKSRTRRSESMPSTSERDILLSQWRKNYCATREEVTTKIQELSKVSHEEILEKEKDIWTRTTPADLFYKRDEDNVKVMRATPKLLQICDTFQETLVLRTKKINDAKPEYVPPPRKNRARLCKHKTEVSSSSDSSEEELTDEEDCTMEELQRKQQHPDRLHPEMWYNDPGEMNDGPLCRCSIKSRKSGIRHGIYPGEKHLLRCDLNTNNADKLYHYRITISPPTNFLIKTPTIIQHDEHEFIFEGFSMFSHFPLVKLPTCKVIRFNIEYTILYIDEKIPDNFTVKELDLFHDYLFREVLELVDLDFKAAGDNQGCSQFHFMPRFVRELPDNGKEILSMKEVLQYLLNNSIPLIEEGQLKDMVDMSQYEWQSYADEIKGMVVTYPGKKPCSVRVDQLDRNIDLQKEGEYKFPEIVHFGIRPPQLSYAGNPDYQKAWRDYVKFRHLLANMSKPTFEDKRKLEAKENKLQEMRTQGKMKRDVTVAVSAEGFYRTGIMCDIIQHAMLIPVLVCHLRFHHSLNVLEESIKYKFKNRALLQLALTHPSYRENFGTNPDHARNSLTNCGIRQPEYGDRRIHYMNTRKRGNWAVDHQKLLEHHEGTTFIKDYERDIKRKIVEDGDKIVKDTLRMLKDELDVSKSDEEIKRMLAELQTDLSASENLFIKGLLST